MSRHGDCIEIAEAARRKPILDGVTTPEQFIDRLEKRGDAVSRRKVTAFQPSPMSVHAPDHGLSLMFVPSSLCDENRSSQSGR